MYCTYCGRERPDAEASAEHVLPRAIGGNVAPHNPFLLHTVCRRCNSAAGRHIDLPFIKSWFTNVLRAAHADRFVDLAQNPTLPLTYGGELQAPLNTNKVCELWIGPSGDSIYFFHDAYPEPAPGVVGPPLNLRGIPLDRGFIFLFIAATNPDWQRTTIRSILDFFTDSTLYLANGPTPPGGAFSDIPADLATLHQQLRNIQGTPQNVEIHFAVDFGHRFLAKLALGFGALLLDQAFVRSPEATVLRNGMWERDGTARAAIPIHGTDFLGGNNAIREALGWPGGHVIIIKQIGNSLLLSPIFYGHLSAVIEITSNPAFFQGRFNENGDVYLVAPGLRRYVGPVPLETYVGARMLGPGAGRPDLNELIQAVATIPLPPPFSLMGPEDAAREQRDRMRQRLHEVAYAQWKGRGEPWGDPMTDWIEAKEILGVSNFPEF